jgi:hypothetical protein
MKKFGRLLRQEPLVTQQPQHPLKSLPRHKFERMAGGNQLGKQFGEEA